MLVEVIKEVRATEEKAEDVRRRAHIESRKVIQDAERKAADIIQQSVAEAEAEGRKLLAAADKDGQELAAVVQQRTAGEIKGILEAARAKQEAAITMVMERIVKTYGHS